MDGFEPTPQLSEAARQVFARTLHIWRLKAGWSHDTLHQWGDAVGFSTPRNSTFSKLERGLIPSPGLVTFLQLGECNRRLAEKEIGNIPKRRLKDQLDAQVPICDPDGKPWRASEFFAHFIGELPAPEWANAQSAIFSDPVAAESVSRMEREAFRSIAISLMLDRREAWQQLESHLTTRDPAMVKTIKNVLAGFHDWTPDELRKMRTNSNKIESTQALLNWARERGATEYIGDLEEIIKPPSSRGAA